MSEDKVYGPHVHRVNPLRIRTKRTDDGWTATYVRSSGSSSVSGCATRAEALASLRHFITMRVTSVDGRWVEVD